MLGIVIRRTLHFLDRFTSRLVGIDRATTNATVELERRRFEQATIASLARRVRPTSRPVRAA